jgi:NAD(P)-dependent dehydrogenase (short-subunit alcohol dehydrogenase family)
LTKISLEGQVAVVTGAGRGIGRAIALGMASAGARVVVNDIGVAIDGSGPSDGPAADVVEEIRRLGGEAVASLDSVDTLESGRRIMDVALHHFGRLDVLVCAAGILQPGTIFELGEENWEAVLRTNLTGHFNTIKPACEIIRQQQSGTILTLTSSGGLEGNPLQPNYSASKEGIIGLTRAIALTLAPYATCNAISPSGRTRMTDRMGPPGRQVADPSAVAPLAVFLSSSAGREITGQVIAIGGERIALYPQPRPIRTAFREGGWTPDSIAEHWESALGTDPLVRAGRYIGVDIGRLSADTADRLSAPEA